MKNKNKNKNKKALSPLYVLRSPFPVYLSVTIVW